MASSSNGKRSELEETLARTHDPVFVRLISNLKKEVSRLEAIGEGIESSDAQAMRETSNIRENISKLSGKLERYSHRKLLGKLLCEVAEETGFHYNDAFSIKHYQVKELEFEDSQAEYDKKKDKIIIKKAVIDSFGGELAMPLYFEPLEEDEDKSEKAGEPDELYYSEIVDEKFIKNLIRHEETHRQVAHMSIEYGQPQMASDDHDELFFHIFKMLGGDVSDAYSMVGGTSAMIAYKEFASELKARLTSSKDIFLINKGSPNYPKYKYLMDGIERYNLAKGTRKLRILDTDGNLEVIKDGKRYRVDIDMDFQSHHAKVNYLPL